MATYGAFSPIYVSGSAGKTIAIAAVSTSSVFGTITSTGGFAPTLRITNPSTALIYVRMSTETTPVAASTDVPMLPSTTVNFANPNPTGVSKVAVISASIATAVFVTPGIGGDYQ